MAKVAVITGSNGKIGQATCRRLALAGYTVVGIDIGAEGKGNWPHYQCDLSDLKQMADVFSRIEAEHGTIGVLFNNAAIYNSGTDALTWTRRSSTRRWTSTSARRSSPRNGWRSG